MPICCKSQDYTFFMLSNSIPVDCATLVISIESTIDMLETRSLFCSNQTDYNDSSVNGHKKQKQTERSKCWSKIKR